MAIKCKPKWFNPKWITIAQISQMVVGVAVSIASFNAIGKPGCWAKFENNTSILIMYISYFFLFVQFFLRRYGYGFKIQKETPKAKKLV